MSLTVEHIKIATDVIFNFVKKIDLRPNNELEGWWESDLGTWDEGFIEADEKDGVLIGEMGYVLLDEDSLQAEALGDSYIITAEDIMDAGFSEGMGELEADYETVVASTILNENCLMGPAIAPCLREDGRTRFEDVSFLIESEPGVLVYLSFFHKYEDSASDTDEHCSLLELKIYPYSNVADKALFIDYVDKDLASRKDSSLASEKIHNTPVARP